MNNMSMDYDNNNNSSNNYDNNNNLMPVLFVCLIFIDFDWFEGPNLPSSFVTIIRLDRPVTTVWCHCFTEPTN